MKLIVGIGNPGLKYRNTRHNIGFRVLDKFCEENNLKLKPTKGEYWLVESMLNTFHFFLMKPSTYVNNSGIAIQDFILKENINISDILVIYDDTNLNPGNLRIRKSGSDGGHNGLKSIIYHLGNDQFTRIRIGVGSPNANQDLADYVLSYFPENELNEIEKNFPFILQLIEKFIIGGTDGMLNYYSIESKDRSSNIT